jgi:hypothetical protein
MPYIRPNERPTLDEVEEFMNLRGVQADGDLNYILFRMALRLRPSYDNYKNFLGELEEAAQEIRRRLLVPYEEMKRQENGDVKL